MGAPVTPMPLERILPLPQLQELFDSFNAFFPVVTALLDLEGRVLQASGWQDICTKFHRKSPDSCRNCTESDVFLAKHVRPGEFVEYRCKNGMWDVVTPLHVDGVHVGNLYTGQFFYEHEEPDEAAFVAQAGRFGFDREAYLVALRKVPKVSRARVEKVMRFLVSMTALLSQLGKANARLAGDLRERQRLFDELKLEQEQRRKLEHSMLQAQKLESLGLLAGGIAHDFNNLLAAITSNVELARAEVPEGGEARAALDQGLVASARATDLTRQLLAYSGRGRFVVEPIDVTKLLEENAAMLRSSVPRNVAFALDVAAGLPQVMADRAQLQQVVMNLVINAAEAVGRQAGTVTLRARPVVLTAADVTRNRLRNEPTPGPAVLLEVRDTGSGMDAATLERLFEPFFTTKFTGRGLGMAAVHGVLSNHGAALLIDSTLGLGTVMRVYLPATSVQPRPQPTATPTRAQEPLLARRGAVLVVDDEVLVASSLRRLLARVGYEPLVAEEGPRALALAKEHPDLVLAIVDLTMPVMSGAEVVAALHALVPGLPIIVSSGFNSEPVSLGAGVVGFLPKPYSLETLERVLKEAEASRG